jgi:hypothetical protein
MVVSSPGPRRRRAAAAGLRSRCPSRLPLRPWSASPTGREGFVLPLAISACLVALLGSLSVQSAVLQSRLGQAGRQAVRHQEDSLVSAAQQLVGRLNRDHPCLLTLPLAQWPGLGQGCLLPSQLAGLTQGQEVRASWRLLDWQPGPGSVPVSALAWLELGPAGSGAPGPGAPGPGPGAWRRATFVVQLAGEPLRAQLLRLHALRGVQP